MQIHHILMIRHDSLIIISWSNQFNSYCELLIKPLLKLGFGWAIVFHNFMCGNAIYIYKYIYIYIYIYVCVCVCMYIYHVHVGYFNIYIHKCFSTISNLSTNLGFLGQNVDRYIESKWIIHDTKYRKDNQSQKLIHPWWISVSSS